MLYALDDDSPFQEIKLLDVQQMPNGCWVVIQVFAHHFDGTSEGLWKLRLLWKRNPVRKAYRLLRIRGPVLPVEEHKIAPIIVDDWLLGVRDQCAYGLTVDTDHHGIGDAEDVYLSSELTPISILDMISACTRSVRTSGPQS